MNTYFAAPERTSSAELQASVEIVNHSPVMTGLLGMVGGLLAVLDERRQIVALNDSFLKMLGIDDPAASLGLRPGEALNCVHAREEPAGCGTTKYCSTCGAAIAIVSSLEHGAPAERTCSLAATRDGRARDLSLEVRSQPVRIEGRRFLLLFLRDITLQQQRAALERTFFHDVNNMMVGILGASEALALEGSPSGLVKIIHLSSARLMQEIQIQKSLMKSGEYAYTPVRDQVLPAQVVEDLKAFYVHHPIATDKNLQLSAAGPNLPVVTDCSLLLRVLCNMVTNALEATDAGGTVKVWYEQGGGQLSFHVWNDRAIDDAVALRIFQRNFSTKEGDGRGLGTYSMKLFGEEVLGGHVRFVSFRGAGTVFTISLPA